MQLRPLSNSSSTDCTSSSIKSADGPGHSWLPIQIDRLGLAQDQLSAANLSTAVFSPGYEVSAGNPTRPLQLGRISHRLQARVRAARRLGRRRPGSSQVGPARYGLSPLSPLDLPPGTARNRLFAIPAAGNRSARRHRPAGAVPIIEPFPRKIRRCQAGCGVPAISPRPRSGGNKEHGISAISPADNALVRHSETWPQQFGYALQLFIIEARENIQLLDQLMRIQPYLEARQWLGSTRARCSSL